MTPDHDSRVQNVQRYWDDVWSKGRIDVLGQFYAANFRENEEELTVEQFAKHVLRWREKFTGFRADVVRTWTTPEAVISRVVFTGTQRGDFSFLPATGRSFRTSGLDVFEFDEQGLVSQHWHETDHWELFEQLGAQFGDP